MIFKSITLCKQNSIYSLDGCVVHFMLIENGNSGCFGDCINTLLTSTYCLVFSKDWGPLIL